MSNDGQFQTAEQQAVLWWTSQVLWKFSLSWCDLLSKSGQTVDERGWLSSTKKTANELVLMTLLDVVGDKPAPPEVRKTLLTRSFQFAGLSSRVRKTISNTIRKESQTLLLLIQILFYSTCEVILELISLLLLAKVPIYVEKCSLDILVQKWLKLDSWKWRNGQLSGKCWLSLLNCISGFPTTTVIYGTISDIYRLYNG